MEGFLLGLSSGTVCLAYCAPVIVPYFLGEGENTWKNTLSLTEFLLGRLAGYILFGIVAWSIGQILVTSPKYQEIFFGIIYVILSLVMAFYGLFYFKGNVCSKIPKGSHKQVGCKKNWICGKNDYSFYSECITFFPTCPFCGEIDNRVYTKCIIFYPTKSNATFSNYTCPTECKLNDTLLNIQIRKNAFIPF